MWSLLTLPAHEGVSEILDTLLRRQREAEQLLPSTGDTINWFSGTETDFAVNGPISVLSEVPIK